MLTLLLLQGPHWEPSTEAASASNKGQAGKGEAVSSGECEHTSHPVECSGVLPSTCSQTPSIHARRPPLATTTHRCQPQLQCLHQLLLKHKLNAPSTVAQQLPNTREGHLQGEQPRGAPAQAIARPVCAISTSEHTYTAASCCCCCCFSSCQYPAPDSNSRAHPARWSTTTPQLVEWCGLLHVCTCIACPATMCMASRCSISVMRR